MSEGNKFVIRRSFEELWNKGNLSLADELFAPNYAHHDPSTPDVGRGPESERKRATLYRTAFPDLQLTIEGPHCRRRNSDGPLVLSGTHKGDLSGIAPTGSSSLSPGKHRPLHRRQDGRRLGQLGRSGPYAAARRRP